ncbi:MAG: AMP-binding protein [Azoarcus sp.]|nr:AMP-binding protein [Azoarcus sp.]MDX9836983.1 AMP-binding protein [Azoarcus sp.]
MSSFPLVSHTDPDALVARRHGEAISLRRFLADIERVTAALPDCGHILNVCADRYRFAVGLAASMVSGRVSLLPSTYTPETLRHLAAFAPDCQILTDGDPAQLSLPAVSFPALCEAQDVPATMPAIPRLDAAQLVAWVFTSGSTGTPVPHRKTWGRLVINVRAEGVALGLDPARPATLIGTVPPQHMYGFESTVLVAWQSGAAFDAGRPFYPADIAATLASTPAPAALITTPFHLRTLFDEGIALTPVALVVSATAPLPAELAQAAEVRLQAPLLEIYGSTETGQIATRRSAQTEQWTLFPDIRLEERDGQTWADGGHIEVAVPMSDVIEQAGNGRFLLRGRNADLINIAGKRTSLGYLNQQLLSVSGVRDGGFHLPDGERDGHITRLAAFVVAPGIDPASLRAALRERIDPAFMPRPLIFLDTLPRNATGKLPRDTCEALLRAHRANREQRP